MAAKFKTLKECSTYAYGQLKDIVHCNLNNIDTSKLPYHRKLSVGKKDISIDLCFKSNEYIVTIKIK